MSYVMTCWDTMPMTLLNDWQREENLMVGRWIVMYFVSFRFWSANSEFNNQEIEATLHCIMSIQEALNLEKAPHLSRLFSPEIFGRLPSTGRTRVRRTALSVIGVYWIFLCDLFTYTHLFPTRCLFLLVCYSIASSAFSNLIRTKSPPHGPYICCLCSHWSLIKPLGSCGSAESMWGQS